MAGEKKYSGYGYHGGGRKATGIKRVSICISGQPEQIEKLKKMAVQERKTVSAFIFEKTGVNHARQQSFKDGAEFGYNKANEWHYVKDREYPTHSNRVLVFTDEGVGFGIYGLDNKKWYTYDTGFDVIAWKEITLPGEYHEKRK